LEFPAEADYPIEVSEKTKNGGWGKSVAEELSNQIAANFGKYERVFAPEYLANKAVLCDLQRQPNSLDTVERITWTNNLLLMRLTKNDGERLFYIRLAIDEKYSIREPERQFDAMRYERIAISAEKSKNLPVKQEIKDRFLIWFFCYVSRQHQVGQFYLLTHLSLIYSEYAPSPVI
jgi:hypothetical protein